MSYDDLLPCIDEANRLLNYFKEALDYYEQKGNSKLEINHIEEVIRGIQLAKYTPIGRKAWAIHFCVWMIENLPKITDDEERARDMFERALDLMNFVC